MKKTYYECLSCNNHIDNAGSFDYDHHYTYCKKDGKHKVKLDELDDLIVEGCNE